MKEFQSTQRWASRRRMIGFIYIDQMALVTGLRKKTTATDTYCSSITAPQKTRTSLQRRRTQTTMVNETSHGRTKAPPDDDSDVTVAISLRHDARLDFLLPCCGQERNGEDQEDDRRSQEQHVQP